MNADWGLLIIQGLGALAQWWLGQISAQQQAQAQAAIASLQAKVQEYQALIDAERAEQRKELLKTIFGCAGIVGTGVVLLAMLRR
ncbi:MAG: hypothetical protein QXY39_04245 [Thermofilaceae archaeon]